MGWLQNSYNRGRITVCLDTLQQEPKEKQKTIAADVYKNLVNGIRSITINGREPSAYHPPTSKQDGVQVWATNLVETVLYARAYMSESDYQSMIKETMEWIDDALPKNEKDEIFSDEFLLTS